MDPIVATYILVGVAGIAGAGMVPDRLRFRRVVAAGGAGGASKPAPDDDGPPIPWWLGGPFPWTLGLLLAEITWILLAPEDRTVVEYVAPILTGFVVGAATKTVLATAGGS